MSDPKLISPLLDNFVMGDPISEHNGVRCCPALKNDTDEKYIVKIISVPASSVQLDALLLSGAYSDRESAVAYYKGVADSILAEVEVLQKLAQLEGFLPIEGYQVVPMDDESGYDVYLLSAYRSTLRHQLRRNNMTHLQALNLGLDLCAALAAARRMGYMYADLKPTNIYLTGSQEYRIGDIGFVSLSALQYQSLPDRYRSAYTAPEIADAFANLNQTIDIYAVGLTLYQVFNGGQLPSLEGATPGTDFAPPTYADYEMSEIILKACAIDPEQRWQDPVEMGQALVNYMQRNGAHDTPIVPETADLTLEGATEDTAEGRYEESATTTDSTSSEDNASDSVYDPQDAEEVLIQEDDPVEDITEDSIYTEDDNGNLTYIEDPVDETMEERESSEIEYHEVTDEVSDMLLQADELIAHETPDPVVAPDPIDVPVPPIVIPEVDEEESETNEEEKEEANSEGLTPADADSNNLEEVSEQSSDEEATDSEVEEKDSDNEDDEYLYNDDTPAKKKNRGWVVWLFALLAIAALLVAGIYGYKKYYIQTIDSISLTGGENGTLTVNIATLTDESTLTVICTDTYNIPITSSVVNGKASFKDLKPGSAYTIRVEISGLHKLVGQTTASYTTPKQINILSFTAVTGVEDGSVILSFTPDGPEPEEWCISYTDHNGVVENSIFSGHSLTIPSLEIGHEYTFTVEPIGDTGVVGNNTVTHTAKKIVKPINLTATSCVDGKLTAQWSVEDGVTVESWNVLCYNETFRFPVEVTECSVIIEVDDVAANYTLEVSAVGMSVSERVDIPKNSVTVKDLTVKSSNNNTLTVSWAPVNDAPADGWILAYRVDNSFVTEVAVAEGNSAVIENVIPGSEYTFELLKADKTVVLGGKTTYKTAKGQTFDDYRITSEHLSAKFYNTSNKSDIRTKFKAGEKASILIKSTRSPNSSSNKIAVMLVIRDKDNNVVDIHIKTLKWRDMWKSKTFYLDIPQLPQVAGDYTATVYFNGALAINSASFIVTDATE